MPIYSRIKKGIEEQNWFAVVLELLIVMMGLLLAFQIDRWYEGQKELKREADYLQRLQVNINEDLELIELRLEFYGQIQDYGKLAIAHQEGRAQDLGDWELMLAYFQASQIWPLVLRDVTYEELKSAGELDLIRSVELRRLLAVYYGEQYQQYKNTVGVIPVYRERIRGAVPFPIQEYIWANCHQTDDINQVLLDCAPPKNLDSGIIRDTVGAIEDENYIYDLRFWMSNIFVGIEILQAQEDLGVELVNLIADLQEME